MISQDPKADAAPVERSPEAANRRWLVLGIGCVLFLAAMFGVSRVGAEHDNNARFAFPDRLVGVKIASPDRAPEARGREIVARYDRRGDGVAGMVVEWLPDAGRAEAAAGTTGLETFGRLQCASVPQAVCLTSKRDGWLRFTQSQAPVAQVRQVAEAFLKDMKEPDSEG